MIENSDKNLGEGGSNTPKCKDVWSSEVPIPSVAKCQSLEISSQSVVYVTVPMCLICAHKATLAKTEPLHV